MAKKWYKDIRIWAIVIPAAIAILGGGIKLFWLEKEKPTEITVHFPNSEPIEQIKQPSEENPLDTNRTVFQLDKAQLSTLTDQKRIEIINKCDPEQDCLYILNVIKTIQRVEGRDEQRIRFINKCIKANKLELATIYFNQLELQQNKDKMKTKLTQESLKFWGKGD